MKVQDVMTPSAHTCRPDDSLERAAQLLWEHDCGVLPVVDWQGSVRAMITDRDICMGAWSRGRSLGDLRVADAMSKGVVSCAPGDDLAEAVGKMCQSGVRRLPVVAEDGRVVGVLSINDLACAATLGSAARKGSLAKEAWKVLEAVSRHRTGAPERVEEITPSRKPPGRSRPASRPRA